MIFSTRAVDFLIARLGVEKKFGERGGRLKLICSFSFDFILGEGKEEFDYGNDRIRGTRNSDLW